MKTWPCTGGCGKGRPAPGDTCPDCILARRQAREATKLATEGSGEARAESLASSPAIAEARNAAVLERLKHGPASFEQLVTVIPSENLSAAAKEQACRSTVLRLKVKGLVKIVQEGYARA